MSEVKAWKIIDLDKASRKIVPAFFWMNLRDFQIVKIWFILKSKLIEMIFLYYMLIDGDVTWTAISGFCSLCAGISFDKLRLMNNPDYTVQAGNA